MGVPAGAPIFVAACFLRSANGLSLQPVHERVEHNLTNHCCRLLCQQHAVEALGVSFASIGSPSQCMAKCDQIYTRRLSLAGSFPTDKDDLNPHMSQSEQCLFKSFLMTAVNYFEFGSGGSTEWAAKAKNLKHIHSVDSDPRFISALRKRDAVHEAEMDGRLVFEHVDIGTTGPWGFPTDNSSIGKWHAYSDSINAASEGKWDLILVDGRFRTSCFLKSLLKAPCATVMVHDYPNHPGYHDHEVGQFVRKISSADRLYAFQLREDADVQRMHQWAEHYETFFD